MREHELDSQVIPKRQLDNRAYWVGEISKLSGDFGADSAKVEEEISAELSSDGVDSILGHLRLCGAIPESYRHDSSEEKLYSKYTDVVISKSFETMGLKSAVLTERADAADVVCEADDFSFVADAKAFRLSRTAKNQKDFKIQAMDNWKHGRPYAMVVCPIYQLPGKESQIYYQAITRSVCIFSYTHLAVLVRYAAEAGAASCISLIRQIFRQVETLPPSKHAQTYWKALNSVMMSHEDSGFSYKDMLAWERGRAPHRAQRLSVVYSRRGDEASAKEWEGWRVGNLRPTFEPILWFTKPYKIGTTIADNVLCHSVGAFNQTAYSQYSEKVENVLRASFGSGEAGRHPTQKPIQLMEALIELTTQKGQLVLDPFCGSGSTLIAAKRLGRQYLGFDRSDKYVSTARDRLSQVLI